MDWNLLYQSLILLLEMQHATNIYSEMNSFHF